MPSPRGCNRHLKECQAVHRHRMQQRWAHHPGDLTITLRAFKEFCNSGEQLFTNFHRKLIVKFFIIGFMEYFVKISIVVSASTGIFSRICLRDTSFSAGNESRSAKI